MKKLIILFVVVLVSFNQDAKAKAPMAPLSLKSIAVLSIDTKGLNLDNLSMGNLVRLELEKTQKYEVLDKYDVAARVSEMKIDAKTAFGKTQLVQIGTSVGADYMLSGSAEKYGEKIIFILRLVDVKQDRIIKTDVKEYVYDEEYIQIMVRLSIKSILNIEYNKEVEAKLKSVDMPVISDGQRLKLSGPRFGMQFYSGQLGERLMAPEDQGGYNSNPFATVFAYQQEFQYVSSGDFQVLLEVIVSLNGIETSYTSPSLALLNGFRYKGWELGFGPVFRFARMADGYYDSEGKWIIEYESLGNEEQELMSNLDKRGNLELSTGLLVAVGKTFKSGHIHLPVNIYYSHVPGLDSHVFGLMLGFNLARKR